MFLCTDEKKLQSLLEKHNLIRSVIFKMFITLAATPLHASQVFYEVGVGSLSILFLSLIFSGRSVFSWSDFSWQVEVVFPETFINFSEIMRIFNVKGNHIGTLKLKKIS